jgi:hypothetical protein
MFAKENNIKGGELRARMAVAERSGTDTGSSIDTPLSLQKALAAVNGTPSGKAINIRGASGVTVEVRELVKGTTAADVEVCFYKKISCLFAKKQSSHRQSSSVVERFYLANS